MVPPTMGPPTIPAVTNDMAIPMVLPISRMDTVSDITAKPTTHAADPEIDWKTRPMKRITTVQYRQLMEASLRWEKRRHTRPSQGNHKSTCKTSRQSDQERYFPILCFIGKVGYNRSRDEANESVDSKQSRGERLCSRRIELQTTFQHVAEYGN